MFDDFKLFGNNKKKLVINYVLILETTKSVFMWHIEDTPLNFVETDNGFLFEIGDIMFDELNKLGLTNQKPPSIE